MYGDTFGNTHSSCTDPKSPNMLSGRVSSRLPFISLVRFENNGNAVTRSASHVIGFEKDGLEIPGRIYSIDNPIIMGKLLLCGTTVSSVQVRFNRSTLSPQRARTRHTLSRTRLGYLYSVRTGPIRCCR